MTISAHPPTPEALAPHYSRFRVAERLLFTGHSHQAWPDCGLEAQQRAWLDAAEHVDRKWARAESVAEEVRGAWRRRLGDPNATVALGQNTHELVCRFLSALPLWGRRARPRLVTTSGEFHTIRRQLDRLGEEHGVTLVKVDARPVATLAERLAAAVDARTAAVLVSSVLFETAEIVPSLDVLSDACAHDGVELLVDAYHHVGAVPFDLAGLGLQRAFVVGGGYKYCQLGEGNCFMRVPPDCDLRPVLTGWFSEFGLLDGARPDGVPYGDGGSRWAGATYDPVSHYRARAVFEFFERMGLTAERLRAISQQQTARIVAAFEQLDLPASLASLVAMPPEGRGGFVTIKTPDAARVVADAYADGVWLDSRGSFLRIGPAPYVSDAQIDEAVRRVGTAMRAGTL